MHRHVTIHLLTMLSLLSACRDVTDPRTTTPETTEAESNGPLSDLDLAFHEEVDSDTNWQHVSSHIDETEETTDEWDTVGDEMDRDTDFSLDNLAPGIRISGVDAYQSTRVSLMEQGQSSFSRWVQLVEEKDALLRISVVPDPHRSMASVMARVLVRTPSSPPREFKVVRDIFGPSQESVMDSTLNIVIPGHLIVPSMEMRVSLHDVDTDAPSSGLSDGAVWPKTGMATISVETTNGALRLVVVPISYEADGSFRLPDTRETTLSRITDMMMAMFPFPRVDLTVADPFPWDRRVGRLGVGWSELLTAFLQHRQQTGGFRDYYFGMITPENTRSAYCSASCVTGISPVAHRDYVGGRAFVTLGYGDDDEWSTVLHELGHAMGRDHAPTSGFLVDPDPDYPYERGTIGKTGYHAGLNHLYEADSHYDIMGYDTPQWISDYTAGALLERLAYVNGFVWPVSPQPKSWTTATLFANGNVRLGGTFFSNHLTTGHRVRVDWIDAQGVIMASRDGFYTPYSDGLSGTVLFETPPESIVAVDIAGTSNSLPINR